MSDQDFFNASNLLKIEGEKILQNSDLINILTKYGRLIFDGSYAFNVMLENKDIDLLVYNPSITREQVVECLVEIINTKFFDRSEFYDRVSHPSPSGSYGYCIQSKRDARDGWKIDIWLKDKIDENHLKTIEKLKSEMTEEKRLKILKFKQLKNDKNLDFPSYKIYEAVVIDEVNNFDEIVNSLNK